MKPRIRRQSRRTRAARDLAYARKLDLLSGRTICTDMLRAIANLGKPGDFPIARPAGKL